MNIAILVSGRGSNLQAIIDSIKNKYLKVKIGVVISNRDKILALEKAKREGIPTVVIKPSKYNIREEYDKKIIKYLEKYKIDLVVLAGYMRLLSSYFTEKYKHKIINIHPSLLPSFPGGHAHQDALNYGVKVSGCTVHFVDEGIDTGPIILQKAVLVYDDDTEETLSERILKEEHKLYPKAIKFISENRIKIIGRKVILKK